MARAVAVLCLFLGACSGHHNPTEPLHCTTSTVFGGDASYLERTEAERELSGRLEFRDVAPTPNGRDYHYFLNNTPVYSGGPATEPIFKAAAGSSVIIQGKLVDVGFGPEIWAAKLTSCR